MLGAREGEAKVSQWKDWDVELSLWDADIMSFVVTDDDQLYKTMTLIVLRVIILLLPHILTVILQTYNIFILFLVDGLRDDYA